MTMDKRRFSVQNLFFFTLKKNSFHTTLRPALGVIRFNDRKQNLSFKKSIYPKKIIFGLFKSRVLFDFSGP
jgi:hypothetical protein